MYAVDPAEVRENAIPTTVAGIATELQNLLDAAEGNGMWVTLSGGNPALMRFDADNDLVELLHALRFRVAVETQGSIWREWLGDVDHLTVSPKPPSSGMVSDVHTRQTGNFMDRAYALVPQHKRSMKIVVFDDADYEWASEMVKTYGGEWDSFLSVGTDQEHLQDEYRIHAGIAERYRWLAEKAAPDPVMRRVKILPQCHVIAFGTGRGV